MMKRAFGAAFGDPEFMDPIARPYYEVSFERDFLLKDGTEFQDWFSRIMGLRHPGDFMPVKPWGNVGDRGGDGYLPSRRTLFQVYAPESRMVVARTLQKINDDFNGALPYWGDFIGKIS